MKSAPTPARLVDASRDDGATHPTADDLARGLPDVLAAPKEEGQVDLLLRRPEEHLRETLAEAELDLERGLVGDCWRNAPGNPDSQVSLMGTRAARLVAGADARIPLAGNQLVVDLDLSVDNLPVGSVLELGADAAVEISAKLHAGCGKFAMWYGMDALKFVNGPDGMRRRLCGVYARVVRPGRVRPGDRVRVRRPGVPKEGGAMTAAETRGSRLAERIIGALAGEAAAARAADVRIGLGYTAVRLEGGRAGLAYTFRDEPGCTCTAFDDGAPLAGRPAAQLLERARSENPIAAALGFACANALANVDRSGYLEGDVLDHLGVRPDDRVGMVGQFRPVLRELRGRCREVLVFERIPEARDGLLPAGRAPELLPDCQVAFLTATSLVNGTIDGLLEMVRGCREVAIVGATTPLLPSAFAGTPVTLLSGVVVVFADDALRVVSEGGGTPALSPFTRKVSLRLGPAGR